MIQHLETPLFAQEYPCYPQYDDPVNNWGKPTGFKRDQFSVVTLGVHFKYEPEDETDSEKVNALLKAYHSMLEGMVGMTGRPIRKALVPFEAKVLKAGVPNANGDIYSDDVVKRAMLAPPADHPTGYSMGAKAEWRKSEKQPWWKTPVMFGVGFVTALLFALLCVWIGWQPMVDYILSEH